MVPRSPEVSPQVAQQGGVRCARSGCSAISSTGASARWPRPHPSDTRVLLVESEAAAAPDEHIQRLHLVVGGHAPLRAPSWPKRASRSTFGAPPPWRPACAPTSTSTGPKRWSPPSRTLVRHVRCATGSSVTQVRSDQFLCHPDDFASWADGRSALRLEDFYRWQRQAARLPHGRRVARGGPLELRPRQSGAAAR